MRDFPAPLEKLSIISVSTNICGGQPAVEVFNVDSDIIQVFDLFNFDYGN